MNTVSRAGPDTGNTVTLKKVALENEDTAAANWAGNRTNDITIQKLIVSGIAIG